MCGPNSQTLENMQQVKNEPKSAVNCKNCSRAYHCAQYAYKTAQNSSDPVPDMTYNVFGGTLNPAQSINPVLSSNHHCSAVVPEGRRVL